MKETVLRSAVAAALLLAGTTPSIGTDELPAPRAELLAESPSLVPGETIAVAVAIQLAPQWHTYWKNPGDAGMPVKVQWSLPPGWKAGDISWPAPKAFEADGMVSYGYEGTVHLLSDIEVPPQTTPGATVSLEADVQWLICRDVCIPQSAHVSLTLPIRTSDEAGSDKDPRFTAIRNTLSADGSDWFCHAFYTGEYVELHGKAPFTIEADDAYFFPETPLLINASADQEWEAEGNMFRLRMRRGGLQDLPSEISGVLLLDADGVTINAKISEKSK